MLKTLKTTLATLLLAGAATAAPSPGHVGGPAPDFTLQALDGGTHMLSQHSGKVVMLFVVGYA